MRFYEILPLAIKQKTKIRYHDWDWNKYILWYEDESSFRDEDLDPFPTCYNILNSDGWSIYKEPTKVADFFVPSSHYELVSGEMVTLYRLETHPVNTEIEGAKKIPGSERYSS
jgi:hypothetical protein